MKTKAFIILVNQARSYVYTELLKKYLAEQGLHSIVISSLPASADLENRMKAACDTFIALPENDLTHELLAPHLQYLSENYDIQGAIATYEGHRLLMAEINQSVGVQDASLLDIKKCFDKHYLRNELYANHLSSAESHIVTEDFLNSIKQQNAEYFIKPRRGIGSFSCFKYQPSLSIQEIRELQKNMAEDHRFGSIFDGMYDFIAESFIHGDEYSFEVIVVDAESFVIGTHAKYLESKYGTTLETANSLPASNLNDDEQKTGEEYIARCIEALGIKNGAYHIETRYCKENKTWNIIEINARMGGAFINQSVGVFTGNYDFLELWLLSILCVNNERRNWFKNLLSELRESKRREMNEIKVASVFFSRYGEPGKTIKNISVDQLTITPDICEMSASKGMVLPNSNRGIFLLNALWKVDAQNLKNELNNIGLMLEKEFVIEYE